LVFLLNVCPIWFEEFSALIFLLVQVEQEKMTSPFRLGYVKISHVCVKIICLTIISSARSTKKFFQKSAQLSRGFKMSFIMIKKTGIITIFDFYFFHSGMISFNFYYLSQK